MRSDLLDFFEEFRNEYLVECITMPPGDGYKAIYMKAVRGAVMGIHCIDNDLPIPEWVYMYIEDFVLTKRTTNFLTLKCKLHGN